MTLTFLVCLCLVFNVLVALMWQLLYISMNPFVRQHFSFVFFAFYQLFWVLLYLVDLIFSYT